MSAGGRGARPVGPGRADGRRERAAGSPEPTKRAVAFARLLLGTLRRARAVCHTRATVRSAFALRRIAQRRYSPSRESA